MFMKMRRVGKQGKGDRLEYALRKVDERRRIGYAERDRGEGDWKERCIMYWLRVLGNTEGAR